jgi:hypothetical protein
MSRLKMSITQALGPGGIAGVRCLDWWKLLAENRFRVSPRFWPRAALLTASSPFNSAFAFLESALHGRGIEAAQVREPLFLLGGWRSGTTHLHNLIGIDHRFGFSNLYQTMYPHSFLVSESWWLPVLAAMTPRKRFQDNVAMSMREPAQDEMALMMLSLRSSMLSWIFPQGRERYAKWLTFDGADPDDARRWQAALQLFLKKLTYKTRKPLVLKSPHHTARIRLILEAFPDAKFLHIHRHPCEVYPSLCHTLKKVIPSWGVQRLPSEQEISDWAIETYRQLYGAYFDQVGLIPAGRFHEISYQQLSESPLETLQGAYEALNLPDFGAVRDDVEAYLHSVAGYERNRYTELDPAIKERLRREWRPMFETWGYESSATVAV